MFELYEKTRRRTRRFPVHLPVQLVTRDATLSGITGDLSLDGANLKLDQAEKLPSTTCRIRIGPLNRLSRQLFFAKVIRQSEGTVALQFVGRNREQLKALDVYLAGLTLPRRA